MKRQYDCRVSPHQSFTQLLCINWVLSSRDTVNQKLAQPLGLIALTALGGRHINNCICNHNCDNYNKGMSPGKSMAISKLSSRIWGREQIENTRKPGTELYIKCQHLMSRLRKVMLPRRVKSEQKSVVLNVAQRSNKRRSKISADLATWYHQWYHHEPF